MTTSNEELAAQFTWIDYLIFSLMLGISAAIGLYYSCGENRQKTARDILVANRNMGVLPISLSLLASFLAAPGVLGSPAEIYIFGTSYLLMALSLAIALPISGHIYLPMFYDLGVTSSYEYLEKRFDTKVRKLASVVFIINMVLFLSIVTYVPALALSQVTNIHLWISISSMGAVCTIYTAIGGIKAVMWTDVFQVTVMFAAMLVVLVKGVITVGGFNALWEIAQKGNRITPVNFSLNPLERHTFWGFTIGASFMWISVYGVNQTQVQRYLSSPTKSRAQIALWLNLPGQLCFITISGLTGLLLYAYYWPCDPLQSKRVESSIQILPLFVMEIMSDVPGLPGVFVAGLFSSSISTLSSGLNALAAVTFEDFILTKYTPSTEKVGGCLTKLIAFGYGILSIGLIFLVQMIENILQAVLMLFGAVGAPTLGVFTLGMMFPCANIRGAIVGFLSGLGFTLWLSIGTFLVKPAVSRLPLTTLGCNSSNISLTWVIDETNIQLESQDSPFFNIYKISYLWYSVIGMMTVLIVGLVVSVLTGSNGENTLDPQLLFYPIRKLYISACRRKQRQNYYMGKDYVYSIEKDGIQCEKIVNYDTCKLNYARRNSAFY